MFKLNETYFTKGGHEARVICVDADVLNSGKTLNIVALVTVVSASRVTSPYLYSDDGKFCGTGNATHDLISNWPNEEEAALIREIGDYCEHQSDDREEKLLKIIRQLRKK